MGATQQADHRAVPGIRLRPLRMRWARRPDSTSALGSFRCLRFPKGQSRSGFHRQSQGPCQGMFIAQRFPIQGEDLVYVTEAPLARWNRLIQQMLPITQFSQAAYNLTASATKRSDFQSLETPEPPCPDRMHPGKRLRADRRRPPRFGAIRCRASGPASPAVRPPGRSGV